MQSWFIQSNKVTLSWMQTMRHIYIWPIVSEWRGRIWQIPNSCLQLWRGEGSQSRWTFQMQNDFDLKCSKSCICAHGSMRSCDRTNHFLLGSLIIVNLSIKGKALFLQRIFVIYWDTLMTRQQIRSVNRLGNKLWNRCTSRTKLAKLQYSCAVASIVWNPINAQRTLEVSGSD